jgi:hypothetical protein
MVKPNYHIFGHIYKGHGLHEEQGIKLYRAFLRLSTHFPSQHAARK